MSLRVRRGSSLAEIPADAVAEIKTSIEQPSMSVVLLFCSSSYDLGELGPCIRAAFPCPVVACTSAGHIGPDGYQRGGMVAASIGGTGLEVRCHLIAPLSECRERATQVAAQVSRDIARSAPGTRRFAFLVVDAMAYVEEALAAVLCHALPRVPVVGGSAGDDLRFQRTAVYWDGEFRSGTAVFSVFETRLPFTPFKVQHFAPTEKRLVITAADPERRLVRRIDGFPAAEAYAESLGLSLADLDHAVFAKNPLLLRLGSEHYVRSIREVHPDGSMTFYSAIDEGLVLTLGSALDAFQVLEDRFRRVRSEIGPPALVIACDCVLCRLELERADQVARMGRLLAAQRVIGFNTYGEQFNTVHMNQTLTAVAFGTDS